MNKLTTHREHVTGRDIARVKASAELRAELSAEIDRLRQRCNESSRRGWTADRRRLHALETLAQCVNEAA